jgi:hypothetical protein
MFKIFSDGGFQVILQIYACTGNLFQTEMPCDLKTLGIVGGGESTGYDAEGTTKKSDRGEEGESASSC